ncbi:arsenate reductase [Arenicella chitinivorans]|uniref:Arsenate reductase n=1 Tax=Arenicella chitinivorans TaxID=1329800 RepID=A0A918RH34_9GAMM|nr:arsenate reductase (glutaredoxin) [Arenicella chitinivorans]GGZ98920.1 arsenate reductase [Arenicella chitinivorans]
MKIVIYHNPRCSKSRQTLELLTERGIQPEIVKYLDTPPSHQELDSILRGLDMEPRQLMRRNEAEYKELGLNNDTLTRNQLIDAMITHPKLIERPIVVAGDRIALGRPPEAVLEILP